MGHREPPKMAAAGIETQQGPIHSVHSVTGSLWRPVLSKPFISTQTCAQQTFPFSLS